MSGRTEDPRKMLIECLAESWSIKTDHDRSDLELYRSSKARQSKGLHSSEVACLLLIQQPRVRIPAVPNLFQRNNYWCCWANHQRWLEESGHWLENVDRTHLVLACGKPILQKSISGPSKGRKCRRFWNGADFKIKQFFSPEAFKVVAFCVNILLQKPINIQSCTNGFISVLWFFESTVKKILKSL